MSTSDIVSNTVQKARRKARSAMSYFNSQNANMQERTSYNYDLFASSTVTNMKSIVSDTIDACNSLYDTLQDLVKYVDKECRPLSNNMDYSDLEKVYNVINWLNEESKVGADFGMSFNNYNLGKIAETNYSPRNISREIQKYWGSLYRSHPEYKEKKKREAELKRQQMQKEKEERERAQKERERIQKEKQLYEKSKKKIIEKRRIALKERGAKEKTQRTEKAKTDLSKTKTECENLLRDYRKEKVDLQLELVETGFFQFSQKNELKQKISNLEKEIQSTEERLNIAQARYNRIIRELPKEIEKYQETQKRSIECTYPFPSPVTDEDQLIDVFRKNPTKHYTNTEFYKELKEMYGEKYWSKGLDEMRRMGVCHYEHNYSEGRYYYQANPEWFLQNDW